MSIRKPSWELAIEHEAQIQARDELGQHATCEEVSQRANAIAFLKKTRRLEQASASFGMADFQRTKGL